MIELRGLCVIQLFEIVIVFTDVKWGKCKLIGKINVWKNCDPVDLEAKTFG